MQIAQRRTVLLSTCWALGATTNDVMRLVVGDAVRVIAIGAIIGLVLSAVLGRLIVSVLFGVQPLDLPTFAFVTIALVVTAAVSVAGPAWRGADRSRGGAEKQMN